MPARKSHVRLQCVNEIRASHIWIEAGDGGWSRNWVAGAAHKIVGQIKSSGELVGTCILKGRPGRQFRMVDCVPSKSSELPQRFVVSIDLGQPRGRENDCSQNLFVTLAGDAMMWGSGATANYC